MVFNCVLPSSLRCLFSQYALKQPIINRQFGLLGLAFIPLGTAHIWATLHTETPTKSMKLICWSSSPSASASLRLVHLNLVRQQLAAAVDMGEDFLFQLGHLLPEQAGRGGQIGVVAFQRFDLVLQSGDPL